MRRASSPRSWSSMPSRWRRDRSPRRRSVHQSRYSFTRPSSRGDEPVRGVAAFIALGMLTGAHGVTPDSTRPGFEDITRKAGVSTPHHIRRFDNPYAHIMAGYTALGASAAVADYDGDGFDDLFVTDSKEDGKNRLYH